MSIYWWYKLRAGRPGFVSWYIQTFLFAISSIPALGPTQPPTHWVPGVFSWGLSSHGLKLPTYLHLVRKLSRSSISPLPQYIFMTWCLVKNRNIYLLLSACCMSYSTHFPSFDHPNNVSDEYKLWSSSVCSFLHSSFLGLESLFCVLILSEWNERKVRTSSIRDGMLT